MYRSLVTGCGAYLPAQIVTNADLAKRIDTTDEWIRPRTGIHQRHVAADGEMTSDPGTAPAREATAQAGVPPGDRDPLGWSASTPGETFPSTAPHLPARPGPRPGR